MRQVSLPLATVRQVGRHRPLTPHTASRHATPRLSPRLSAAAVTPAVTGHGGGSGGQEVSCQAQHERRVPER